MLGMAVLLVLNSDRLRPGKQATQPPSPAAVQSQITPLTITPAALHLLLEQTRWPPFVMVYRETGPGFGPNGAIGSQVSRLEYRGPSHFRVTILEHSGLPDVVGSVAAVEGNIGIVHDPTKAEDRMGTYPPGEEPRGIGRWLVPGATQAYAQHPEWTTRPLGNGLIALEHQHMRSGRLEQTTVHYRAADGIPVLVAERVDGVEVERLEVLDLQIGPEALAPFELTPTTSGRPIWIVPTRTPGPPLPGILPTTTGTPLASPTPGTSVFVNPTPPLPVLVTLTPVPVSTTPTPGPALHTVGPSITPLTSPSGTAPRTPTLVPTPTPRPTLPPPPSIPLVPTIGPSLLTPPPIPAPSVPGPTSTTTLPLPTATTP